MIRYATGLQINDFAGTGAVDIFNPRDFRAAKTALTTMPAYNSMGCLCQPSRRFLSHDFFVNDLE